MRPVATGRRMAGAAAVYTAANIANSAIPFLLLPLLTRVLSPEEYGLVSLFTTLATAFTAIAGLSVHGAINVRYFDASIEHPRYVGTALALLAVSTGVLLVAVLLAAPWLSAWTHLSRLWLAIAVAAAATQFLIHVRLTMWQVDGNAFRYGAFQVGQTALNLTLSLLLIGMGLGWQGRALGYVIAVVAFAAIGLATLHAARRIEWRIDPAYVKDALRFGVPLIPHVLGTLFIASSDRLMVASLTSVHEAGIYAAGMQVGLVIAVLADAAVKALGPWLFSSLARADEATKRRIVRATYLFFLVLAVTALAFGLVAPRLLLLVGSEFRSSEEVVMYIALGGAFAGMYMLVVNYIFFASRNGFLSAASMAVGIFNLAASYLLIGRNGAVGAAQAYAASQGILFLLVWFIAAKSHPMPWATAFRTPLPRPVSI